MEDFYHRNNRNQPVTILRESDNYKWFDQKIDHFDPSNKQTFKQRYIVDDQYYSDSHILFMYISGEQVLVENFTNNFLSTLAQEYGGYLAALEHRYYGESNPFTEFTTENLTYLNSRQALADLADFIQFIQKENSDKDLRKVIIAGGSYSGSLAAWFRQMYPHLVIGAISSSGPVHAVADFYEYDVDIYEALDEECRSIIHEGVVAMHEEVVNDYASVQKEFNCTKTSAEDFLARMGDMISGMIQYNMDQGAPEEQTKKYMCDIITKDDPAYPTPKDRLYHFYKQAMEDSEMDCDAACDTSDMLQITADNTSSRRQWFWQTCKEFGYYQTSPPEDVSPYLRSPWYNLSYSLAMCEKAFGIEGMTPDIESTNLFYHSLDSYATNVIFLHGGQDPWHKLGITPEVLTDDGRVDRQHWRVYEITNGSHCTDLHAPADTDTDSLIHARNLVRQSIDEWLDGTTVPKEFKTTNAIFITSTTLFSTGFIFCLISFIVCLVICCGCSSKSRSGSINSRSDDGGEHKLYSE